jgi:Glycosyltransferase family 87
VLLVRRDWSAMAAAAAAVALLVAGTLLWFGWQPWAEFLFHVAPGQASMIDARGTFYGLMSTSTAMALTQLGVDSRIALLGQAVAAIAGVLMVVIAAYRRIPARELSMLVATCTFLVLPYGFNYDLTVVCVGALALMQMPGIQKNEYRAGFYGFICPQIGMITAAAGAPLMPVMLLLLAIGQFHCWGLRRSLAARPDTILAAA